MKPFLIAAAVVWLSSFAGAATPGLELVGTSVIPHEVSSEMRYRRPTDTQLGARVQLFLSNPGPGPLRLSPSVAVRLRGKDPETLLADGALAWFDLPSARVGEEMTLPAGAMTVWTLNTRTTSWGVGTGAGMEVYWPDGQPQTLEVRFDAPRAWVSSVTFLGAEESAVPDSMVVHVVNAGTAPLRIDSLRLWLPEASGSWRALRAGAWRHSGPGMTLFPAGGMLSAGEHGCAKVNTGRLPLGYAALEVNTVDGSGNGSKLWAHLRIKRESFDIGGGWVASGIGGSNTLHIENFLKTLGRMHVNSGMHDHVAGYTDNPSLFAKYPLKYMNRCQPFAAYDNDAVLPRVHAVEFLGEPQYGGGRPVPPMEVWRALAPYQPTRLPTSVTHSEERIWRDYAGLSDFPHYDAYRVCAPAPDAWAKYDRWGGERITWGAPLETIGDMTRSLRNLNRPTPVAYWSQGAHDGWDSYGGRKRTSPNPAELRLQAYHALSSRITSLYWFNLSLKSVVKFRDLIEPITRVGREIRVLAPFYLEGDAYAFDRTSSAGRPDWDLASIAAPEAGVMFALDLNYRPDPVLKEFVLAPPREAVFRFRLPAWLRGSVEVLRVDADSVRPVPFQAHPGGVEIHDRVSGVAVYVAATTPAIRPALERRLAAAMAREQAFGFDPAGSDADFNLLSALVSKRPRAVE